MCIRDRYWMYETINEQLKSNFYNDPEIDDLLRIKQRMVLDNKQSSFVAAGDILKFYFDKLKKTD